MFVVIFSDRELLACISQLSSLFQFIRTGEKRMLSIADIWMYQIVWDFLKKMVVWNCTLFSFLFFLTWAALAVMYIFLLLFLVFFCFCFYIFFLVIFPLKISLNIFLDLERSFVFMASTFLLDLISVLLIKIYYCNKTKTLHQYNIEEE